VASTAGSTNWLAEDEELPQAPDLDVMVVRAAYGQPDIRPKFISDVFSWISPADLRRLTSAGSGYGMPFRRRRPSRPHVVDEPAGI